MKWVIAKIERWWEGEYRPYENDPRNGVIVIGGYFERHWTSNAARSVVEHLQEHWKFWIMATIAAVTAWAGVAALNNEDIGHDQSQPGIASPDRGAAVARDTDPRDEPGPSDN